MRPRRLELQGFGSFRDHTVVEFEGSDLFVLTGPTGSGKSTIIDGITFALYGAIPRYERDNLIAPIISNGKEEARVRLDFSLGEREFTAVRVVRRTATGATTREARLEEGSRALAGTSREMAEQVPLLLGLSFGHFQKCVVLPQGAFAQLLHDDHSSRLELLRSLLDMRMFVRMRERANARAQEAGALAAANEGRLTNELADATQAALAEAKAKAERLKGLAEELDSETGKLQEAREKAGALLREIGQMNEAITALAAITAPVEIGELAGRAEAAREAMAAAGKELDAANDAVEAANAARDELPRRDAMEKLRLAHEQAGTTRARLEKAQVDCEEAIAGHGRAKAALDEATAVLADAQQRREEVLKENHAFRAARDLKAGDRCPVCGEVLKAAPRLPEPPGHAAAQAALDKATEAHDLAGRKERAEEATASSLREEVTRLERELGELLARVEGEPDAAGVEEALRVIEAAEERLEGAQKELRLAQAAAKAARDATMSAERETTDAWAQYDRARDSVAGLSPPPADRDELRGSWAALVDWAQEASQARQQKLTELRKEAEAAEQTGRALLESQRARCDREGVPTRSESPLNDCNADLALAEERVRAVAERIETAQKLRAEQAELKEREQVARELGRHLRGDRTGFESWYVRRVLEHLADGASETLQTLSREQFSLALNDNQDFEVIDHGNADDRRLVRTLSGGETFLASLALALALADSFAMEAAGRAPRLEAMFLDEGFGTLDPETLDVVASAIEELAAGGRMVGLVTHVPDLAARMPVRYEVRRGPGGSTIERVEA